MIEFKKVCKRYGNLTVYENFDFCIEEGKITCLLGESGCGKTTLLNMLAGTTPYEGYFGPRRSCSYIFQEPRLVPALTVEGNLKLVCKDASRRAELLALVGLADKAQAYPSELSGGQAQRVSVARAFAYPSQLILMDEPFSSLDTAMKIRLIGAFCELWRRERRTAVFVTHDVEEAYMLAHRAIVLRGGKIAADVEGDGEIPRAYGESSRFRDGIVKAVLSV